MNLKKVFFAVSLFYVTLFSGAQKWNPYVSQGSVNPSPLLPAEFNGTGVLSFKVGNSGDSPITLKTNQEMTMIITLSYGIPDGNDPVNAVGGDWSDKFRWSYDPTLKSFTAIQTEDFPAGSSGTISIKYKVTSNSGESNASNGLNVNLQQPPYTIGVNYSDDDAISAYTYVQARDFSDAPASYGTAQHIIDIRKDHESGNYENYLYLGSLVDPENGAQFSSSANGDDNLTSDDEEGVVIPDMTRGDTVIFPVIVTVQGAGSGTLNAWLDWNGDGDFKDTGEKIAGPLEVFESDTINLEVVVPEKAFISGFTFARFRLGDFKVFSETGECDRGEVEDYEVRIKDKKEIAKNLQ